MKRCLKNGLWLLRDNRGPYAIVMSQHDDYGHGSFQNVEVAAPPRGFGAELASRVFDASNGTSRAGHALVEGPVVGNESALDRPRGSHSC